MDFGTQGSPGPADLAWVRGVDAYTMGAYPQAEEEFRAAVRMDPGMADGWLGLHALRIDTTTALLRMFRHRDRFGEQRTRHRRTLNSWYWLGWWVQPVLERPRDLLLAHASHWLDGRHVPDLDGALATLPRVDADPQVRFLHACRAYLVKDWEQLVRHTDPLLDDGLLGIEAGLFGGMARVRLEMYGQAEPLLSAALMRCRSEQPQRKELRYWLARAHEGTGRSAAALPLYRAVHRVDPAFMDTSARLAAIAESDGYGDFGDGTDLSPLAMSGLGQDVLDGSESMDPLYEGDGRNLKVSEPDLPPPGAMSAETDAVREKAVVPITPQLPAGPADPALLEEALAELERMVGLEPVKRQVKALSAQLNMARLRAGQGLPVQPPKRHFVFSGPSGTGKTTVARILGRVFYALGLLGGDHLVESQRADLVGEYLGQTAVKANELIDSAIGGVLFVDEAYALSNSGYGKGDAYGDEALQVLLKRAEDNRDHLVVIRAGYPEGMDRLLAANPGLSSRFTTRVDFPSDRPLELTAIGEVLAAENGDVWDEEALDELRSISGHVVDQGW
ncbi:AAA family ATPase, partial [Streptomyces sp. A475]|uniref:AAA family ATPase n=1 Tax=Streptomyces sp. A475 TaxID=3131976 RepID=UPI0030C9BC4C